MKIFITWKRLQREQGNFVVRNSRNSDTETLMEKDVHTEGRFEQRKDKKRFTVVTGEDLIDCLRCRVRTVLSHDNTSRLASLTNDHGVIWSKVKVHHHGAICH